MVATGYHQPKTAEAVMDASPGCMVYSNTKTKRSDFFFLTFRSSIVLSCSLTLTLVILEIQSYANCLNWIEREINPNTISSFSVTLTSLIRN